MLEQITNQEDNSGAGDKSTGKTPEAKKSRPNPSAVSSSGTGGGKNILSSDVHIKGKLRFSDNLIIDGRIEGEVNSEGDLTVGENARIVGNLNTCSVVVYGKVEGNITVTDRCELKQNAALHGDVIAGKLAIEEGATFMGTSTVGAPRSSQNAGKTGSG